MMGRMDKNCEIIENTQEAMDAHGHLYGSSQVFIAPEELKALESGKLLAVTVNYEYVVFIGVEQQGVQ